MQLSFKTLVTKAGSDRVSIRKLKAEYFNNQTKLEESKIPTDENLSDRDYRVRMVKDSIKKWYEVPDKCTDAFITFKLEKSLNVILLCLYYDKYTLLERIVSSHGQSSVWHTQTASEPWISSFNQLLAFHFCVKNLSTECLKIVLDNPCFYGEYSYENLIYMIQYCLRSQMVELFEVIVKS